MAELEIASIAVGSTLFVAGLLLVIGLPAYRRYDDYRLGVQVAEALAVEKS